MSRYGSGCSTQPVSCCSCVCLLRLLLVVRRRLLSRSGGTFELSVRFAVPATAQAGRGWVLGLGRYRDEQLEWFRIFSPWPRPRRQLGAVDSWRSPASASPPASEAFALYGGHLVVECRDAARAGGAGDEPFGPDRVLLLAGVRPAGRPTGIEVASA